MGASGLEVADIVRQARAELPQAPCRCAQSRAAPRHERHRAVPHGGARRPRRAVRPLRPPAHRLQLVAAIGTARSASRWCARNGWKIARPTSSPLIISTSSSPCRRRSPRSPTRTRPWSTTFCFAPRPRPCARSPLIPSTWAPRSASSPSCIPGARTCCITRICIAWSRAAA